MTYQINAVRINDDGTKEDCVITLAGGVSFLAPGTVCVETMQQLVSECASRFTDIVTGCTYRYGDSWDGTPSLFFTLLYRKGRDVHSDFPRIRELESELRGVAHKFEPNMFPYMNLGEED